MSLPIIVSLAVRAPAKTRFGKQALLELALLAQYDFGLEDIDLASQSLWHSAGKLLLPK